MTSAQRQRRIFFALWPDTATRERLASIAARMPLQAPASRVPQYNLHLTLHFIGNVDARVADDMCRRARIVEAGAFDLEIDRSGHFGGPRVGWLGCDMVPAGLRDLHARLGNALRDCGYTPEARDYRPHVTVARKVAGAPAPVVFEALRWKVDNFVLLESRATARGVEYQIVESYPLM